MARGRCRGTADSVGTLRGVAAPARSIHICSSRTCRGRKVLRWNPAPQETLSTTKGAPTRTTVKHVKTFERSSGSSYGSSSSSRSTGLDRGRLWRSQAAQTRLVPAAGRLRRPRQATSHTDTLTDTFTDMENLAEAAPAKYGTRHAGSGRIWACKARLMRTGAEDLAVWRPKARSGPPGIHFVPGHVHLQCRVDAAVAAAAVAAVSVQSQSQPQLLQL